MKTPAIRIFVLALALCALIPAGMAVSAQDSPDSRRVGDNPLDRDAIGKEVSDGPVRLARFTYVSGSVSWRPADEGAWSDASANLPIRQGAQIWTVEGGRAEIQFDDGSLLRLGSSALATLQTLYSDADGEFTQITLRSGFATLKLVQERSLYQIDMPFASAKAVGPSRIRANAGDTVEIAIQSGSATVENKDGKVELRSGDYLDLRDSNAALKVLDLPRADTWDQWNDDRDKSLVGELDRPSRRNLPPNIALVAGDLDSYGAWRRDPAYGEVWCPRVTAADWRPYHYGHWVWVNPFGWTWVSDEPWGWAPYHYGTWIHGGFGWAWVPGPAQQYWSPAVVHYTEYGGRVAWVPLAPREVRYPPTLGLSVRGADWSLSFSIGRAAVYYPTAARYCVARPFNTAYVNRVVNVTNVYNRTTIVNNTTVINRNSYLVSTGAKFIPMNARQAGVSVAETAAFGGRGRYQLAAASQSVTYFAQGHVISAPAGRFAPVAGPVIVKPTRESLSAGRSFVRPAAPDRVLSRAVYSAPVHPDVVRRSTPTTPSGVPIVRTPRVPATIIPVPGAENRAAPLAIRNAPRPAIRPSIPVAQPSDTGRVTTDPRTIPGRSTDRESAAAAARRARSSFGFPTRNTGNTQSGPDRRIPDRRPADSIRTNPSRDSASAGDRPPIRNPQPATRNPDSARRDLPNEADRARKDAANAQYERLRTGDTTPPRRDAPTVRRDPPVVRRDPPVEVKQPPTRVPDTVRRDPPPPTPKRDTSRPTSGAESKRGSGTDSNKDKHPKDKGKDDKKPGHGG